MLCKDKKFDRLLDDVSDPVVVNIVQDIFKKLAGNEACAGPLEHRLLPTLVSILQAPDKVPVSLPPVSHHVTPNSGVEICL